MPSEKGDGRISRLKKLQCAGKLELTRFTRFPSPEVYLFVFLDLFIFLCMGVVLTCMSNVCVSVSGDPRGQKMALDLLELEFWM